MSSAALFQAMTILSVDEHGVPTLEGTNAKLVMTTSLDQSDIGKSAVCQRGLGETPSIVVFGVLDRENAKYDKDAPLVLEKGASSLALFPDGRIRLNGIDVKVAADAVVSFDAARIDLN